MRNSKKKQRFARHHKHIVIGAFAVFAVAVSAVLIWYTPGAKASTGTITEGSGSPLPTGLAGSAVVAGNIDEPNDGQFETNSGVYPYYQIVYTTSGTGAFYWRGRSTTSAATANIIVQFFNGTTWANLNTSASFFNGTSWTSTSTGIINSCPANTLCEYRNNNIAGKNNGSNYNIRVYQNSATPITSFDTDYWQSNSTQPNYVQDQFQFLNDDGLLTTSSPPRTQIAAANTAVTLLPGQRAVIRMRVNNTGNSAFYYNDPYTSSPLPVWQLNYRDNAGGSWAPVTSSSPIQLALSKNSTLSPAQIDPNAFTTGSCAVGTTPSLSSLWQAGSNLIRQSTGITPPTCQFFSWVIQVSPSATAGKVYSLRVGAPCSNANGLAECPGTTSRVPDDLDSYTQTPQITVSSSSVFPRYSKGDGISNISLLGQFKSTDLQGYSNPSFSHVVPVVDGSNLTHYFSSDGTKLIHYFYVGTGGTGCPAGNGEWICETFDTGATYLVDAQFIHGKVRLLYRAGSTTRYAEYVGAGGTGCTGGSTAWSCVSVSGLTQSAYGFTVKSGAPNTVVIVGANGAAAGAINYCEGVLGGTWTCSNVIASGMDPSIALDASNRPRIAYFVTAGGYSSLVYAECNATCTSSANWTLTTLDYMGTSGQSQPARQGASIQIDESGNPHIAYTGYYGSSVYYARKSTGGGDTAGCSYDGTTTTPNWHCEATVNSTGGNPRVPEIRLLPASAGSRVRIVVPTGTTGYLMSNVTSGGTSVCGSAFTTDGSPLYARKVKPTTQWLCNGVIAVGNTSTNIDLAFDNNLQPLVGMGSASGSSMAWTPNYLPYGFDPSGYTSVATDDSLRDSFSHSGTVQYPMFSFEQSYASAPAALVATWKGQSSVAASGAQPGVLQIFRFGTTWQWETVQQNTSAAANTDFALSTASWTPAGAGSEYSRQWVGGQYRVFWRVYYGWAGASTLRTNLFTASAGSVLRVEARSGSQAGALITGQAMTFDITGAQALSAQSTGATGIWSLAVSPGAYTATPNPTPLQGTYSYSAGSSFASSSVTAGNTLTLILVFTPATAPVVNSPTATSILYNGATLGATISSTGGASITARGTCWGTTPAPTSNCQAEGGTATGVFSHVRTSASFAPNTSYYYRGYATNSVGTAYSADATFITAPATPGTPTFTGVGPVNVVNWTHSTPAGTAPGTITYQIDRCAGPGCSSFATIVAADSGTPYNDNFAFVQGQTYRYRIRSTNNLNPGVWSAYSGIGTLAPPTVALTTPATNIGANSASARLTSIVLGGTNQVDVGTCRGTTPAPTTCSSVGPTSASSITLTVGGLSSNTLQYYRGYAQNAVGRGYTADDTVLTLPGAPGTPTFTNMTDTSTTVNWTSPGGTGTLSYYLERCYGTSCTNFVQIAGPQSGLTFNDTGLVAGTYRYQVRASNTTGFGAYSAIGSYTINTPPTLLITQPLPSSLVVGKTYTVVGVATDLQGGNTILGGVWALAPGSASGNLSMDPSAPVNGNTKTFTATFTADVPGRYQLRLSVLSDEFEWVTADTPTSPARTLPNWIEVNP